MQELPARNGRGQVRPRRLRQGGHGPGEVCRGGFVEASFPRVREADPGRVQLRRVEGRQPRRAGRGGEVRLLGRSLGARGAGRQRQGAHGGGIQDERRSEGSASYRDSDRQRLLRLRRQVQRPQPGDLSGTAEPGDSFRTFRDHVQDIFPPRLQGSGARRLHSCGGRSLLP